MRPSSRIGPAQRQAVWLGRLSCLLRRPCHG